MFFNAFTFCSIVRRFVSLCAIEGNVNYRAEQTKCVNFIVDSLGVGLIQACDGVVFGRVMVKVHKVTEDCKFNLSRGLIKEMIKHAPKTLDKNKCEYLVEGTRLYLYREGSLVHTFEHELQDGNKYPPVARALEPALGIIPINLRCELPFVVCEASGQKLPRSYPPKKFSSRVSLWRLQTVLTVATKLARKSGEGVMCNAGDGQTPLLYIIPLSQLDSTHIESHILLGAVPPEKS
jgi:hypothetical protein